MEKLSGVDFFPLRFDRKAKLVDSSECRQIQDSAGNYDHLLILAHGWNNDMDDARRLYVRILSALAQFRNVGTFAPGESIAVVGVYWPSKKFTDSELIPGGAASKSRSANLDSELVELTRGFYQPAEPVFDGGEASTIALRKIKELLDRKQMTPAVQLQLAELIRGVLGEVERETNRTVDEEGLDAGTQLGPSELLDRLRTGWVEPVPEGSYGEGGAAGFANPLDSLRDGVMRALNYTTYYQMRERAGRIGRALYKELLEPVMGPKPSAPDSPPKAWPTRPLVHLVGHSFGGRLVASAALGTPDEGKVMSGGPLRFASMVLLQAAFSHYGFASRWDGKRDGLYRTVVRDRHVMGPVAATYTSNDKAVGIAYPLASALAGQVASGIGGPDDRFGGIGSNGAQKTPESTEIRLLVAGSEYDELQGGRLYNARAEYRKGDPTDQAVISDHSDIDTPHVAWLIINVIRGAVAARQQSIRLVPRQAQAGTRDYLRSELNLYQNQPTSTSMQGGAQGFVRSHDTESSEQSRRTEREFDGRDFGDLVVVERLWELIREKGPQALNAIVIDLNLEFVDRGHELAPGRQGARRRLARNLGSLEGGVKPDPEIVEAIAECRYPQDHPQYVYLTLTGAQIRELVSKERGSAEERSVRRIWPDFEVRALTTRSIATIKADAARRAFSAVGLGVTWAVLDSGIDAAHAHFEMHRNLEFAPMSGEAVLHRDFTKDYADTDIGRSRSAQAALVDVFGHGTHVAGIIAGEYPVEEGSPANVVIRQSPHEEVNGTRSSFDRRSLQERISGMAPATRLVSIKVLDEGGRGPSSALLRAIRFIQEVNGYGRRLVIHGVNLSLGYDFDPEWFACGKSPVCVEVDQLVRSGVVVVVAAGNSGYGAINAQSGSLRSAGLSVTINDPGNARLAITVGSTHREMPHIYGVSYFSSKGPTGDGRMKPDLIAPGEKIISCATGSKLAEAVHISNVSGEYIEDSGTSMAAPHVAGAIAAFLSIRREFIGQPEEVKRIFCSSATDLGREKTFQGYGLVDLMRAIQSI